MSQCYASFGLQKDQFIDIVVADIPEAYGLVLSWDWSTKLNGYFASDWSHMWLPYKGSPN